MLKNDEILHQFSSTGVSVAAWARSRGFPPQAVYRVLRGDTVSARGRSHKIAVALGLKNGQTGDIGTIDRWLERSLQSPDNRPGESQ